MKVEDGKVTIRKEDGNIVTFPLERLTDDDQAALRKLEDKESLSSGEMAQPVRHPRVYPRTLETMKADVARITTDSLAQRGFTEEEQKALVELNIHRYLSGVPGTVELDRKRCDGAVRASEACAKIGEVSHDASPEGQCCNLGGGSGGGTMDFPGSVEKYIEDPGA